MDIKPHNITVRELAEGYEDNEEGGVVGYGGKLDIRPPYQREFIYKDKQRALVIDTVLKGHPLNVMYWAVREDAADDPNDRLFEVIDGQQRTISICQFVKNEFSFDGRYFRNLESDEKEKVLNYELSVYRCTGTPSQKLAWFETINIAGEELTKQELRNAVYHGSWVADAKRYFSKRNCPAYNIASDYMRGAVERQDYLEEAIEWIGDGAPVRDYMAKHQHDPNANELWLYFNSVIEWVKVTFPKYRREMKGIHWGLLYNKFKDAALDPVKLEEQITALMLDEDVQKKSGIYLYVLDGLERHLNIRAFSDSQKREAFERQNGVCPDCGDTFTIEQMEADHITPWHEGGKTSADNCQMLCQFDNRKKGKK